MVGVRVGIGVNGRGRGRVEVRDKIEFKPQMLFCLKTVDGLQH